ncbi:hypothetical protein Tco_1330944, partial [Tanacetum coccineum]
IKLVLTLKALKCFCETYHIPDEDHPQLPSPNQTIQEMPIGKIVSPARASSELEASVDKLFDKGGSGSHTEQGDSVSGRHGVSVQQVSETEEIVAKDAAPVQPRRQRKRKTVVSDAGEPSHPPKKLREDHITSTRPSVTGKSRSAL